MECPYCKYVNGFDNEYLKQIDGEHGGFYYQSNGIMMERQVGFCETENRNLYGCPQCGKLFIDI